MAIKFNKNTTNKRIPIKRNSKFFGEEDFDLMLHFAEEYIEEHANQTIILYRVDLNKTKVNDIYKEAKKDSTEDETAKELDTEKAESEENPN